MDVDLPPRPATEGDADALIHEARDLQQKLAVRQIHGLAFRVGPKAPAVHVLQSGKSAQIDFIWRNWCGSPTLYNTRELKTVRLRLGIALAVSGKLRKPACVQRGAPSTVTVAESSWVLKKPFETHHRPHFQS
jgi:hypothetical protein